jgi:uncharacterized ion transporter superfamily protein YfcC
MSRSRAIGLTLLLLILVYVLFVPTWFTIPAGRYEVKNLTNGRWQTNRITYPARLFRVGLPSLQRKQICRQTAEVPVPTAGGDPRQIETRCVRSIETVRRRVDLHAVRERVLIVYGGLAVIVVLVGLALTTPRRARSGATPS